MPIVIKHALLNCRDHEEEAAIRFGWGVPIRLAIFGFMWRWEGPAVCPFKAPLSPNPSLEGRGIKTREE
jgi:hypothetical protein